MHSNATSSTIWPSNHLPTAWPRVQGLRVSERQPKLRITGAIRKAATLRQEDKSDSLLTSPNQVPGQVSLGEAAVSTLYPTHHHQHYVLSQLLLIVLKYQDSLSANPEPTPREQFQLWVFGSHDGQLSKCELHNFQNKIIHLQLKK